MLGLLRGEDVREVKMIKLRSKLENNLLDNVLVKKGITYIEEEVYNKLLKNETFKKFCDLGYIAQVVVNKVKEAKKEISEKPDFTKFSYQDLKKYVKEHNIKVKSQSKDDILKALGC